MICIEYAMGDLVMKFSANRLSVLSGLEDSSSGKLINESTKKSSLNENALRKMIREEIEAYLSSREEKQSFKGLKDLDLTTAMGYLNATPPYARANTKSNRSFSRGPGRSFAFGGPGFM